MLIGGLLLLALVGFTAIVAAHLWMIDWVSNQAAKRGQTGVVQGALLYLYAIVFVLAYRIFSFGFTPVSLTIFIISITVCVGLQIWLINWIHQDARGRGQSSVIAVVLVSLLSVIGFLLWLVIRGLLPKESSKVFADQPSLAARFFVWFGPILRKYAIVIIFIAMFIAMALLSDAFLSPRNLLNIVRQISVVGLIAIGVTMVIITTGIDLSSGSVLALAAVVSASLAQQFDWHDAKYPGLAVPLVVPIIYALYIGAFCGFINGSLIARFKIPPFIATLGMMTIARGFALIYSNRPVSGLTDTFNYIGQGEILKVMPVPNQPDMGVPIPILILLGVAVVAHIMLNNTRFGRHIYAIGGNEQAARISGLNVGRIKIGVYTIAGILSGLSGLVLTSRIGSGQAGLGVGYELDAIAAAVIGGTSLSGGIGTIWGTMIGALIIGVLNNGLDLLNVSAYWQTIVKGSIIVAAVIIDERKNR